MRNLLIVPAIIFGCVFFFSACGEPEVKTAEIIDSSLLPPPPPPPVMPTPIDVHFDSLEVVPSNPGDKTTTKEVTVSEGIVYCTLPYCGGARPSEEIVAEKKKSILLTNSTLMMKNKKGVEYLVTTNDKGIFRSGIPAGQYDIYLTENTNKAIYNVSPETCENCLTKPTGNVIIQKGIQASCTVHFNCAPGDKKRQ
ncbi:MAG: hypothetical protein ABIQ40_12240 [Bacteroidia bacterium]